MLDGIRPVVGDSVWDVLLGRGRVLEVMRDGGFSVQFATRKLTYLAGGTVGVASTQRVFWQDMTALPRPLPGPEGLAEWQALGDIITKLRAFRSLDFSRPAETGA